MHMNGKPARFKKSFLKIMHEIAMERSAQDEKWGIQNHPNGTSDDVRLICEAQAAKRRCSELAARGHLDWKSILSEEVAEAFATGNDNDLRTELLQVAAVAIAWIECVERRNTSNGPKSH